jgi:cell division protein FtsB
VAAAAEQKAAAKDTGPRSRLTSRAAVLVLVVAVLVVSYASSMKAFLQQRAHINDLQAQIAQREANIDALEAEKRRWSDEAYVEQQARARLGYVKPGEKSYLVLDENGDALRPASDLDDPGEVLGTTDAAWWSDAWASVELAGNPPKPQKPPASEIDGSDEPTELGE